MKVIITQYVKDEDGAVTVDWVVLTAAMVGLAVAVISAVTTGALDKSTGIGAQLEIQEVEGWLAK